MGKIVGNNFTKRFGEKPFINVFNGVVNIFFSCGNTALCISFADLLAHNRGLLANILTFCKPAKLKKQANRNKKTRTTNVERA